MDQEEVNHTSDRVRTVHSRGAILQNVDVIDHGKGYQLNVRTSAKPGDAQRTEGHPFAVNQNQSLLRQDAAQVELDATVTTISDVLVNGSARLLRDECLKVGCVADTQLFDVLRSIGVHWIRARLFRRGNIRTSHDDALDLGRRRWRARRCWSSRSRQLRECVRCKN